MTRRATRVERLVEFRPVDLFLETFLPRDNLPVDLVQPFSHICHSAWSALDQMEYQPWFLYFKRETSNALTTHLNPKCFLEVSFFCVFCSLCDTLELVMKGSTKEILCEKI